MSKKLIAVASAAALAVSALVAVPAIATGPSFTFNAGTVADSPAGTLATAPALTNVVATNVIDSATDFGVQITVSGLATGDVVRLTSTGDVKLVEAELATANANVDVSKLGSQDITKTTTSAANLTSLFAFTTSTTAGTVNLSVTRTGLTSNSTLHLKGVAGKAYNLTLVSGMPATLGTGATSVVNFTATDALGNAVETVSAASLTDAGVDKSAATSTSGAMATVTYNATEKVFKSTLTSSSNDPFIASLTLTTGFSPDVVGLPKAKRTLVGIVNSAATASANAAATAQIAALTAQLAASRAKATSVTKKRYNTLARKWNAANPSAKVKLKK